MPCNYLLQYKRKIQMFYKLIDAIKKKPNPEIIGNMEISVQWLIRKLATIQLQYIINRKVNVPLLSPFSIPEKGK